MDEPPKKEVKEISFFQIRKKSGEAISQIKTIITNDNKHEVSN